jgi:hypothetical protein
LANEIALGLAGLAAETGIGDPTLADNWRRLAAAAAEWTAASGDMPSWTPIPCDATDWVQH